MNIPNTRWFTHPKWILFFSTGLKMSRVLYLSLFWFDHRNVWTWQEASIRDQRLLDETVSFNPSGQMLGYFSSVKKQIEKQKKRMLKNNQQNKYEYVHIVSYLNKKTYAWELLSVKNHEDKPFSWSSGISLDRAAKTVCFCNKFLYTIPLGVYRHGRSYLHCTYMLIALTARGESGDQQDDVERWLSHPATTVSFSASKGIGKLAPNSTAELCQLGSRFNTCAQWHSTMCSFRREKNKCCCFF